MSWIKQIALVFSVSILFVSCNQDKEDWKPLFNGNDIEKWEIYLGPAFSGLEHLAEKATPENVYSLVELDGENILRISGDVPGSIATKETFENYHLRLTFKWGNNVARERNSGLLYHSYGPFGAALQTWMASVEFQMMHDNLGDTYIIGDEVECEATVENQNNQYIFDAEADKMWFGKKYERRKISKMLNAENPLGEWNTLELYCLGQTAVHVVNGKTVMVNKNISINDANGMQALTKGKIQIQSEGAELFIKNIDIKPLHDIPLSILKIE